jgi:catechol 2,3-dioxygenase-like lactoylglutathione lyase family enzyme
MVSIACLASALADSVEARQIRSYDHVHFAVPDPERAQEWYKKHIGGSPGESADRLSFGAFTRNAPLPVQLLWQRSADARPSNGAAIESIGFSFADLDAKVRALESAGARIITPVSDGPGWKRAAIEDPWGVRIELVEDPGRTGFHHVTLRVPDPDRALEWHVKMFGGKRSNAAGSIDALDLGSLYLLFLEGDEVTVSQESVINHIGWAVTDMNATATRLKADGANFSVEPREALNRYGHRVAFIDGPDGVRIEIVEHIRCAFSASEPSGKR